MEDAVDATPGDGLCRTAAGRCTLHAAVQEANATPGTTHVVLPPGHYALAIAGSDEDGAQTGDLDVTGDLQIRGAGVGETVLDAYRLDGLFHVARGGRLAIAGLAITGGAAQQGGAVLNEGTLQAEDAALRGNAALSDGGGLHNTAGAKATLTGVTVEGNVAERSQRGGGIFNAGTLTLENSSVDRNEAVTGAGVANSGTLVVAFSTFGGNKGVVGGALYNDGLLDMTGSTIDGNSAEAGGGLFTEGDARLSHVAITDNRARFGGGIHGAARLAHSVLAGNLDANCDSAQQSGGHNVDSDGSCGLAEEENVSASEEGNASNVAARLSPPAGEAVADGVDLQEPTSAAIDAEGETGCAGHDQQE